MIVTEEKPLEEIMSFLSGHKKILIAGCDGCDQPPRGLREAKSLALLIEMASKLKGEEVETMYTTVIKQCDDKIAHSTLSPVMEGVDAVVSLSCGIGVQVLSDVLEDAPVFPGQNTMFMGSEEREMGTVSERCAACGNCILDQTAGICPIARCSKSLLNGPCGGSQDGKCEVDKELDCAWQLIHDRLKALGRLDQMDEIMPINDWSTSTHGGTRRTPKEMMFMDRPRRD
ncbi:MAG: methylenetetrahydrofolate reductase C-terminal domain-containing protein [Candidatus Thermoplasmatota archaeon]|nr:methylenetetrahydrofolate reductase C-terminal domain-containing protein [Candidatus Thermoplasmatota archaeon]